MLDYRIVIVVSSGCNWNLRCLAHVFLSPTAEVINLPSHKPATAPIADWHRNTLDVRCPAEKQDGWFLCFKRMLSIKQKKTNVVMSSESINYWSKTQQLHAQTHIVRNNLQPLTDVTVLSKLTLVSMGAKWLELVLIQQGLEKWVLQTWDTAQDFVGDFVEPKFEESDFCNQDKKHPTWRFQWESKQLVAFFFREDSFGLYFFSFIFELSYPHLGNSTTQVPNWLPPSQWSFKTCSLLKKLVPNPNLEKNQTHVFFESKNP